VVVRDPDDALAVAFEKRLAGAVLVVRVLVIGRTVGFDSEAPVGPAEVGDDGAAGERERDVDVRGA
jgi:hypothetical protein